MKYLVCLMVFLGLISCNTEKDSSDEPIGETHHKENTRPNILFIMTDDHSKGAMSCYGSDLIQTPNLDLLADNGILFNNCAVTNALCGPSRAVMLTGKYSHINGFKDNRSHFDGNQQTFPKLLQQAGYETMMIGKWHLHTVPQGFDYWNVLIGQGTYYSPTMIENGDTSRIPGYVTDIITDISIAQLKKRDKTKPFCLLYHQKAPHRNWMPNVKDLDTNHIENLPLPDNFFDNYENRTRAAHEQDMEVKNMFLSLDMKLDPSSLEKGKETGSGGNTTFDAFQEWQWSYNLMSETEKKMWNAYYLPISNKFHNGSFNDKELAVWKYQRYMHDYLKCIKSVDDNLGRMIQYLKETGEWDNTLIVYTSDQGFFLGEHGWYDKRFMYEESLLTPFIMKLPAGSKTGTNNDLVMNLDFAPTLLEYAGVSIPDDIQGKSLKPLIEGKKLDRKGQYYHYYEFPYGWHLVKKHYGVRTDGYKLIHFYQDVDEWELYDLKKDPKEMQNVYNTPTYLEVQNELHQLLKELQKEYKDENVAQNN